MSHCLQPKLMLDGDYAAFEAGSLRELDFTWTWPSTAPPLTLGVITSFCGLSCQSVLLQSYPPSPQKAWRLQTPTPLYRGLGVRAVRGGQRACCAANDQECVDYFTTYAVENLSMNYIQSLQVSKKFS